LRYDQLFYAGTGSGSLIEIQVRRWHQCLRRLYFQVHQPALAEDADEGQEARLEQGQDVGLLAQRRFPAGGLVGFGDGIDGCRL
jgi:hypothetical protein